MAVKLDEARIRLLKTNGTTTIAGGHVYLTGSSASSSTGNTTQLVFGTSSSNHVVLSSNDNALVINPTTSSTTNQIVLYLNQKAKFPSGIDAGTGGITTAGAISATGNISGNYIQGTWLYTSAATAQTTTSKIAVIHSDGYIYYITPADLTTLIKDNASGTWAISISGNAATASSVAWGNVTGKPSTFTPSSHTHSYIASKGNYTFDSSTLPNSFDLGLSCGFVDANSGFGSYGGVITHRAYSGGGGSLQLYSPYSSNYGGTHLKARFGNYSVSSGNSWTDLKEIAWVSDIPTKISQLTNDASGTWSISISENAATASKVGASTSWLYFHNSNELNFGGSNTSTTIYFGYRAVDSRAIPAKFIFGGSTGSADLQAKTVYLGSGTTSYISSTQYTGNAATATKLGTSTVGAADRPIYLNSGTATQTTYRMAATNATATSALAITSDLPTGIWYVSGTSGILNQADGVVIANQYNSSWITEIYQDYRTGQLAVRGKNNGTWQSWRKVLDSTNYSSYALPLAGGTMNDTAQILRASASTSWVNGRQRALLAHAYASADRFTNNQYNPLWSAKSINGSWDCGTYTADNSLYFTYITDTNFDAGTNTTTHQVIISGSNGKITASGFVGPLSGNATSATTASKTQAALSLNGKSFDGSTAVDMGTLGAAYGGTGQTSLVNSANALLNALSTGSSDPTGNDYYISQYAGGGTTTTTYHRRPVSKLYNYIKGAASGTWGISISGNAATASSVAWSNVTGKPSTFTPSSHTHSYITSQGATVANTRTPAYSESLITGGWASADAGYGSTYGTTLDVSGYSTWYHRLAFHTNGQIDYWMGINTTTLAKQCTLITSANYSSYALPKTGGTLTGNLSIQKASWGTFAFKNENNNSVAQIAISNSANAFDGKLTFRCYSNASTFATATLDNAGVFTANQVKGAVWNDYAEYRWVLNHPDTDKPIESGRCVAENGNDSMSLTHDRLQAGVRVISDTYGMCMGETEKAKTPVAVCGRVLAYPFERKVAFNVGDPVCSGPNGTVSKMSREEAMMYPERIVGTVVSKPTYKEWGPNKIPVKGRIWIQVR